jgi:hypothetical protein
LPDVKIDGVLHGERVLAVQEYMTKTWRVGSFLVLKRLRSIQ